MNTPGLALGFSKASRARVCSFDLGGKSWTGVDKETAQAAIRISPEALAVARENFKLADRAAPWAVALGWYAGPDNTYELDGIAGELILAVLTQKPLS
jgi:hypothetical protein